MNDLVIRTAFVLHIMHYPLFDKIGDLTFVDYEQRHTSLTTWVVGPPMLIELCTSMVMLWYRPSVVSLGNAWFGIALLFVIWISTSCLQVPCHHRLSKGYHEVSRQNLVKTNWIRTLAWSLRGLIVSLWIWNLLAVPS